MNGFNLAESGHVVQVLPPQSISAGKTGQAFSMKNAEHASVIVGFGTMGANAPTAILVNQCTDASGTSPVAIPFRYYFSKSGGQTIDQTSPPVVAAAAGILQAVINKLSNEFILIELDSAELADGSPYAQIQITDSGNATTAFIYAILSGLRFAGQGVSQPSATA